MHARVLDILLDRYKLNILNSDEEVLAISRGNVKKKDYIKVGDIVKVENIENEFVITDVEKRKNDYIRPPVSNIDYMFIAIAAGSPKPDFLLLDKQIITAEYSNSVPIIVVNKTDLENADEISSYVLNTYTKLGYTVILTNTKNDKLVNENDFRNIPQGSLCAFSGNSGVGKSSIISKIKENIASLEINSISEKTGRGRHTTKAVSTYTVLNNDNKEIYFLDTPGFSNYDIFNISSKELKNYFHEFNEFTCEYLDCNHINEDLSCCSIKKNVQSGNIDSLRYEHYVKIYQELLNKEKKLYK